MNWRIFKLFWVFFLISASWVHAETYVSGPITSDTTWTEAESPYIASSISVVSGVTLTLEPGVVVKINGGSIDINGTLIANGTADKKIYFTSILDDAPGGWGGINVWRGGRVILDNTVVRYAGYTGIYINYGEVSISNSDISHQQTYGIFNLGGRLSLLQSNIHDNNSYGVFGTGGGSVLLTNNNFSHNYFPVYIDIGGGMDFSHDSNTALGNYINAFGIVGATQKDYIWTADNIPYYVAGVTVSTGNKLTIGEGVMIKSPTLTILGALDVLGSSEKPVYFTSIKDDTVGGDTNNDGSASTPQMADGITMYIRPGGTANFNNAKMFYGGAQGIIHTEGETNITDSSFSGGYYGILVESGTITISHTDIVCNNFGLYFNGGALTISQSSIHDNNYYGAYNAAAEILHNNLILDARSNWWGDASGPHNSIFNPLGFGDAVSTNVNFTPWLGFDPVNTPPKPDPVIIIPGMLGSAEKNGKWVIDPILHTYDDLVDTLEANGYVKGVDLFTFGYDWHQSNIVTAQILRDKINVVQDICQCQKVDLVAHSMGGLVARQYIQSDYYENDVDQMIFMGTPHLGAPKDYLMWEAGENDLNFQDQAIKFIFSREAKKAGFTSLFNYIRNKPISSVQELLPIYDYLRDKSTDNLRTYPNNYPQNTFLENLKIGVADLFDRARVTNITGDLGATSTVSTLRVVPTNSLTLWKDGYPDGFYDKLGDHGLELDHGDGTVPQNSAEFIASDLNTFVADHGALVTKAEGLIFKKLTNNAALILINNNLSTVQKILIIKLLSPVDMQIVAPDGKRIGKDFATGGEFNEIDGAFYSGFDTDDEYITIPNPMDGEYKIETVGTGSGEYTVATGYISDNVSVDQDFTGQTSPGLTENLNIEINNSNPTALVIVPQDATPPSINIISPIAQDYLRSATLPINIAIQDADTGVASSTIMFGGKIINSGDSIDLFFEKLGLHSVSAFASDFLGNASTTTVNFRVIATLQSTISDIDRAYTLGWISKKSVHDSLVSKLQTLIGQNKDVTQKTLKSFLATFDKNYPKYINDQTKTIIIEDINWILNNGN